MCAIGNVYAADMRSGYLPAQRLKRTLTILRSMTGTSPPSAVRLPSVATNGSPWNPSLACQGARWQPLPETVSANVESCPTPVRGHSRSSKGSARRSNSYERSHERRGPPPRRRTNFCTNDSDFHPCPQCSTAYRAHHCAVYLHTYTVPPISHLNLGLSVLCISPRRIFRVDCGSVGPRYGRYAEHHGQTCRLVLGCDETQGRARAAIQLAFVPAN